MEPFDVVEIQPLLKAGYYGVLLARIHLTKQFTKHGWEDYDFGDLFSILGF